MVPVYLDHAATTPMRESARLAWFETAEKLSSTPGNPSSLHAGGRAARLLLEDARERLAVALGAERPEVIFTSGATESAALGVTGGARSVRDQGVSSGGTSRWIWLTSAVEHPAVREQKVALQAFGIAQEVIPVDSRGVIELEGLEGLVGERRLALASAGLVCSETGVVQPLSELVSWVREFAPLARVHSDATQAVGNLQLSFAQLDLDLLTLGGHKFGAPVGTGALLVKRGVNLVTDRPGGGHESGRRSGTPDVAGAVALSIAAEEAVAEVAERAEKAKQHRDYLVSHLPRGVTLTTSANTVPSIVHLSLPTSHPEVLLLEMDRQGVHVSAGSACHAGVTRPSSVLLAMGRDDREARGVLRVSLGKTTTTGDIDAFLGALPHALEQAQRMDRFDSR
ncbi:cysteine desulfurase family protein [Actinomyces minihominis]|uniref:cysteine desulfurase family protein n=1 Tax=Actinomyces minihominis TaxID=2002838 RepID=UPI001F5D32B8|nr:aminotransferase class V-fold PLP-dependent enzyme [Actinomyces minihominis]